jgi:hypothetical protein
VTSAATNIGTGNNIVVSTGAAAAPATSGNVLATRNLGTAPGLNTDLTAVGGGVFARSGLPGVNANGLATATGSVSAPSTVIGTRSGSITGSAKAGSVRAVSGKGGAILLTNQGAAATAKGGTK